MNVSAISHRAATSMVVVPLAIILIVVAGMAHSIAAESRQETTLRCGWFDNPTPNNASLHDRHGEWTISIQGDYQATGEWPQFKDSQWVRTGTGSYGYGCACMRVQTNAESHEIVRIVSTYAKPLSVCRRDKALKEPENPLK